MSALVSLTVKSRPGRESSAAADFSWEHFSDISRSLLSKLWKSKLSSSGEDFSCGSAFFRWIFLRHLLETVWSFLLMELYGSDGSPDLAGEFLDFIKNIGRSGGSRGELFTSVCLQLESPSILLTNRGQSSSFWKTFFIPIFLLLQWEECLKAGTEGLMSPSRTLREAWRPGPGPTIAVIRLGARLLTLREGLEDVGQKPEIRNITLPTPTPM